MKRACAALALLLAVALTARPQAPDEPKKLTLRPAAAPTPALKYRLLPVLADMKPGNAALLYQRAHSFEWWTSIRNQPKYHEMFDWNDLPFKDVPREKIEFLRHFAALREVDRAARREHCDWEMTERIREEGPWMLIPDVQGFREYAGLLALRCRLEIADKQYDKALYTLQTGLSMSRHVGDAPTLINGLVGVALARIMLGRVEELIQAPDAPNLYWALTDLPRPLIGLRKGLQGEALMVQAMFPGLKNIETETLSPREQQKLLKTLRDPVFRALFGVQRRSPWEEKFGQVASALRAYLQARRNLIARGRKAEDVKALPVLQVILLDDLHEYRRHRDDLYKWSNVPYWQAAPHLAKVERDVRAAEKERAGMALFLGFLPALQKVFQATARLDRSIAALRCIEAVRLHAAAHGGKLPARLSDVTEVPVPDDPATGKSFVYQVDGDRVTLRDSPAADGRSALHLPMHYEITFKR